ncbi:MAG: DEAD/DEAH box helicase family protein [Candidatus Gracilibacteria bacterium]|jgi:superfamily II DNA or RNA helicase
MIDETKKIGLDQYNETLNDSHSEESPVLQDKTGNPSAINMATNLIMRLNTNFSKIIEDLQQRGINLRLNQLRAFEDLKTFLSKVRNPEDLSGFFIQPTGAGKTVLFGLIAKVLDIPTLILVPRVNLLRQTKNELIEIAGFTQEDIGMIGGKFDEQSKTLTISTYQSHLLKMKTDIAYAEKMKRVGLIICDEAHRSLGTKTVDAILNMQMEDASSNKDTEIEFDEDLTEEEIVEAEEADIEADSAMETFQIGHALKIGFTATPDLAAKSVYDRFGECISRESYADLIKAGVLVPFKLSRIETNLPFDEPIGTAITEEQEERILKKSDIFRKLLADFIEKRKETPLIPVAFCTNIAMCDMFEKIAREEFGLRCRILTSREEVGDTGLTDQAGEELVNREIDLLITVSKLNEGWNLKPLNAVIFARATNSPAIIIQSVGRASRTFPGKPCAHVFEPKWGRISLKKQDKEETTDDKPDKKDDESKDKKDQKDTIITSGQRGIPISLAQALFDLGEEPCEICENLELEEAAEMTFEKRSNVPQGWISITDLAIKLNRPEDFIIRTAKELPEYKQYTLYEGKYTQRVRLDNVKRIRIEGKVKTCFLDNFSALIEKRINSITKIPVAPQGWIKYSDLISIFSSSALYLHRILREIFEIDQDFIEQNLGNFRISEENITIVKYVSHELTEELQKIRDGESDRFRNLIRCNATGHSVPQSIIDATEMNETTISYILSFIPERKIPYRNVDGRQRNTTLTGRKILPDDPSVLQTILEKAEELKQIPEGYKTFDQLLTHFKVPWRLLSSVAKYHRPIKKVIIINPDFKNKELVGCYSPREIALIAERLNKVQKHFKNYSAKSTPEILAEQDIPEGWLTIEDLNITDNALWEIERKEGYFEKRDFLVPIDKNVIEQIVENYDYKTHYSPESVEKINKYKNISEGWVSINEVIKKTGIVTGLDRILKEELVRMGQPSKEYLFKNAAGVFETLIPHYPAEIIQRVKERLVPYKQGWEEKTHLMFRLRINEPVLFETLRKIPDPEKKDMIAYMVIGTGVNQYCSPAFIKRIEENIKRTTEETIEERMNGYRNRVQATVGEVAPQPIIPTEITIPKDWMSAGRLAADLEKSVKLVMQTGQKIYQEKYLNKPFEDSETGSSHQVEANGTKTFRVNGVNVPYFPSEIVDEICKELE